MNGRARSRWRHAAVLACALGACHRSTSQRIVPPGDAHVHDAAGGVRIDASSIDAGPSAVLTVRVVNAGAQPLTVYTNPDANEMLHTRKLYARRNLDAATYAASEGELVKFFTVGREPLCSADAGAGYGGLGQPEQHALAPGEALSFPWDGRLRREVIGPMGACVQIGTPEPGRYRFEFDQPYNPPQCNRPVFVLPLAPDAPRTLEIRCTSRPPRSP